MQWTLARSVAMRPLLATSRRTTVSGIRSLLHQTPRRFAQPRPPSLTSPARLLTSQTISVPRTHQQSNHHRGEEGPKSNRTGSLWVPLGIMGGIALAYGAKRTNLYCDAPYMPQNASMRLQILHAQSTGPELEKMKHQMQQKSQGSLLASIVRLLAPECWLFLGVALTAVGAAIVSLWTPVVTGDLINVIARSVKLVDAMDESILEALKSPARKLFLLFFSNGLLTFAHTTLVTVLGERIGLRLHAQAMDTLLAQDLAFFDRTQSGELVARLAADIGEFQSTFKKLVTQGLKSATLSLGVAYQLFRLSPPLTLTLLATMPPAYFGLMFYGKFLRILRRQSKDWEAVSAGIAGEAVGNIRTVRSLSAEQAELALYREARNECSKASSLFGMHMGVFRGLTNTAIGGMVLVVLYNGGRLVAKGEMSPGDLMAFMIATQAAQRALDSLGSLMGQAVKAKSAVQRVLEILQMKPAIPRSGGVRLPEISGHVRFMDVDFAYPSRPDTQVLQHFNLDVPAGEVIALCGLSGSGKSTVAALLERFYDPIAGEIWLDACPLTKLDASWLRAQIGYIPQDPALFSTSIRENLRMARPSATDLEIEAACRQANAHDFISQFPNAYDTVVGERGALLSGGQKQRVAIARAILRDPRILVLDEATSALDAESERLVQAALDRLMVGRTVLVIAHRLTTIRNADRIVVMGKVPGHIVEQGSHAQLLAKKGAYFKLYNDMAESERK